MGDSLASDGNAPHRQLSIAMTGATGFVGLNLHRALLQDGHMVTAIVRPGSRNNILLDSQCQQVPLSLTDRPGLRATLAEADVVLYCAGAVRGRSLAEFEAANVVGIRNVMRAASEREAPPRVLFVSSLAATRPRLSHYANSKHLGEVAVGQFDRVNWTILRPPAIYGPGDMEMRPLLNWARRGILPVVGPPDQRISLLHVTDLVRAIQSWLICAEPCKRKIFEIHDGRSQGYDWHAIGRAGGAAQARLIHIPPGLLKIAGRLNLTMAGWFGYAPMLTPGKVRELHQKTWICDNAAFSAATRWKPEITLAAGIKSLYATTRE